jgi:putative nucleotidyltransferase with HDIG domain
MTHHLTKRFVWITEIIACVAAVAYAINASRADQWQPLLLVALLGALALIGDRLSSAISGGVLSTSHTAMVLAICLLGPAPVVAFGVSVALVKSALRRLPPRDWLTNLLTQTLLALAGWLLISALIGNVHDPHNHAAITGIGFGVAVFAVSLLTITVNFTLVAFDDSIEEGRSFVRQARESFIPVMPAHLAAGLLAGLLAVAYTNLGLSALVAGILVIGVFHYLTAALLRSEERADQLEARSIHLAGLQVGVLTMLMDALALRDRTTSLHATAVARSARALAVELGCDEAEQDTVHTAGLLHDIGKFTWSDRVLHPQQLTDEDWAVIRRHPQDGATLVGKLDGYGDVADAILYHHERFDGGGYPAGLIGNEIPLASRIVAICSTYDTMTARSTYSGLLTPAEAITELRKSAGGQFDGEIVETFVSMVERGALEEVTTDVGYEAEIDFAERVRRMAAPVPGRTAERH